MVDLQIYKKYILKKIQKKRHTWLYPYKQIAYNSLKPNTKIDNPFTNKKTYKFLEDLKD